MSILIRFRSACLPTRRAFGALSVSACLLAAGCSGGEVESTPIVGGDESGLVELEDDGAGNTSGPAINAMTPGGKGPKMAPEAP